MIVLMLTAIVLMATAGWFLPAIPFNGLSILAFALLWITGTMLLTKTKGTTNV